jgi:hypothetical protein
LYVFYRYFVRFGWLDGKEGFVFHVLQGFWYRLLVDINLDELRAAREPQAVTGLARGGLSTGVVAENDARKV